MFLWSLADAGGDDLALDATKAGCGDYAAEHECEVTVRCSLAVRFTTMDDVQCLSAPDQRDYFNRGGRRIGWMGSSFRRGSMEARMQKRVLTVLGVLLVAAL